MKAKEVIGILAGLDPDEQIIVMWWQREEFTLDDDGEITPDMWQSVVTEWEEEAPAEQYASECIEQMVYERQDQ